MRLLRLTSRVSFFLRRQPLRGDIVQKLLDLSSAELAIKFVHDPYTFAAAIDEFADICERWDPIFLRYLDPIGELQEKFEDL